MSWRVNYIVNGDSICNAYWDKFSNSRIVPIQKNLRHPVVQCALLFCCRPSSQYFTGSFCYTLYGCRISCRNDLLVYVKHPVFLCTLLWVCLLQVMDCSLQYFCQHFLQYIFVPNTTVVLIKNNLLEFLRHPVVFCALLWFLLQVMDCSYQQFLQYIVVPIAVVVCISS